MTRPEDDDTGRLSAETPAAGHPTGWFERFCAEATQGPALVPWERGAPAAMLLDRASNLIGNGRRAVDGHVPRRRAGFTR